MIKRTLAHTMKAGLGSGKAMVVTGPRQVGKTTLLRTLFPSPDDTLFLSGDELDVRRMFEDISTERLRAIIGDKKNLVIDEAQRIADIGLRMKLITDHLPGVQLVATGSSSFDLANKVNEPLTGRKREYRMFPLSFAEMVAHHGLLEERRLLPHRLVYGYYPEAVTKPGDEREVLKELSDSYLYKDILMWEQIKRPEKLLTLLSAIAFHVGHEVSYNELGRMCGLDSKTVEKYICLLEQTYVIFRLGSFSRNLRNELKSSRKIYFYDNGIRNAVTANFLQIETRADVGALWENFVVSERQKKLSYDGLWRNTWFWRTTDQKEIDYIEEGDGTLSAFEFKWNPAERAKVPAAFMNAYPGSSFSVINRDNFEGFVL